MNKRWATSIVDTLIYSDLAIQGVLLFVFMPFAIAILSLPWATMFAIFVLSTTAAVIRGRHPTVSLILAAVVCVLIASLWWYHLAQRPFSIVDAIRYVGLSAALMTLLSVRVWMDTRRSTK